MEDHKDQGALPQEELSFLTYITSMSFQAMIFLGQMPNPMTQEISVNLKQAKLLVDTLIMLQEKTKGNLTESEKSLLDASVLELESKCADLLAEDI